MEYCCSHSGCPNWAMLRCDRCTILEMPNSFGRYCSRDCQLASHQSHLAVHHLVNTANKSVLSFQGIAESIALAMKDASTRYLLPDLGNSQTVSILLAGCRDFVEGCVDFYTLYELLVALNVFPNNAMQYLEVTLCGPELTSRAPFHHPSGRVKVVRASGRIQRQFPTSTTGSTLPNLAVSQFSSTIDKVNASHYVSFNSYNGAPAVAPAAALYEIFSCVFIRQPGFSITASTLLQRSPQKEGIQSMLEQWVPGIRLLLDSGVLVLVAEYPNQQDIDGPSGESQNIHKPVSSQNTHLPSLSPSSPQTILSNKSEAHSHSVTFTESPSNSSPNPVRSHMQLNSPSASHHPDTKDRTKTTAEYYLDMEFHAKIVIPATPYPFRRQKWSAPFPVIFPDPMAVPHCEVYEPIPPNYDTSINRSGGMVDVSKVTVGGVSNTGLEAGTRTTTHNMAASGSTTNHHNTATLAPDGYYLAFQGRRDPQVTTQIKFFICMAELNAHLRNTCLLIARELGAGMLHLPLHWAPEELELEAHRRDMAINPLKKQLLEKEKQDIMKRNDAGKGPGIEVPTLQFTRR